MQKSVNLIIAITGIIFLGVVCNHNTLSAFQCDSTLSPEVDTVTVGGCEFEVNLCIECLLTHPGEISVEGFTKLDSACAVDTSFTYAGIVDQIYTQITTSYYWVFDYCQMGGIPCDEIPPQPPTEVSVTFYRCWQMHYNGGNIQFRPGCTLDRCIVFYHYCVDTEKGELVSEVVNTIATGDNSDCPYEAYDPEVQEPKNYPVGAQISECYIYHTECDN